jgi:hypothetical protein
MTCTCAVGCGSELTVALTVIVYVPKAGPPIAAAIALKTAAAGNLQPESDNNERKQEQKYKSLAATS